MADQGRWFKLWCAALDDAHLENLELDDWARWVRLGTYIKRHGKEGKIIFSSPGRALTNLFRVPDFDAAITIIKRFPSCTLGERSSTVSTVTNETVSYEIEYLNWFKYQGDFSSDRVRKFRDKKRHHETAQEERRGEETRGEKEETRGENVNTVPGDPVKHPRKVFSPPAPEEVAAYAKEQGFSIDASRFVNHYGASGWMRGKTKITNWKLCANTWKNNGGPNVTRTSSNVRLSQSDPERVKAYEQ